MSSQRIEGSDIGLCSELFLFQPPVTNSGIDNISWVEYRPLNDLSENSSIEFNISGSGSSYLDFRRSKLHIKAKIIRGDNSTLQADDSVGPINLWLHSLFSQVDVTFQSKTVSSSGTNYGYKALIDVLLNYGIDAKESQLQAALFYKDTPGNDQYLDATSFKATDAIINAGLKKRADFTKESQVVDMEGVLLTDLVTLDRFLINGVQVGLRLFQSKDPFRLMAKDGEEHKYKVVITDAIFKACQVNVSPGLIMAHAETIKKTPAIYPFTKSDFRTFNIATGSYAVRLDDIFQGEIPTRIVCGFVKASAYSGNYTKNPFNFKHCDIEYIAFYANGQSIPTRGLQPNFKRKNFVEAYTSLFNATGTDNTDLGCFCERTSYDSGCTLICFSADSLQTAGDQPSLKKGNLSLEIRMSEALEESMTLLIYASFPSVFKIDEARAVIL